MKQIIKKLKDFTQKYQLIESAKAGFDNCIKNNPELLDELPKGDIELKFWSQNFVIEHSRYEKFVIKTTLHIICKNQKVGYYCLITDLDGKNTDDYLVII